MNGWQCLKKNFKLMRHSHDRNSMSSNQQQFKIIYKYDTSKRIQINFRQLKSKEIHHPLLIRKRIVTIYNPVHSSYLRSKSIYCTPYAHLFNSKLYNPWSAWLCKRCLSKLAIAVRKHLASFAHGWCMNVFLKIDYPIRKMNPFGKKKLFVDQSKL